MARRSRSTLPVDLGRYGDDPFEIVALALRYSKDDPRMAAERAYLAMHTALENAVGQTFRTDRAQVAAVASLARCNKKLAKQFNLLKDELHGRCFYRGECTVESARDALIRATKWLNSMPKRL